MGFCTINSRIDIFTTLLVTCLGLARTAQSTSLLSERRAPKSIQQPLSQQQDSTIEQLRSIENALQQSHSIDIQQLLPPLPPLEEIVKPRDSAQEELKGKPTPSLEESTSFPEELAAPPVSPHTFRHTSHFTNKQMQLIQQMTDFASNVIEENRKLSAHNDAWSKYCKTLKEQTIMMREANERYPKLSADARTMKEDSSDLQRKSDRLQKQREDLTQELRNLKGLSNSSDTAWQHELHVANNQLKYRNEQLEYENGKYDIQNAELKEKYNRYSIQSQQLQSTYQAAADQNVQATTQMKDCTEKKEMLKKTKLQREKMVTESMTLQADMTNEILELKDSIKELENMNSQCSRVKNMR